MLFRSCIHFAGELLEDALRSWGLSPAQDAGDCARLLEAPSPLILVAVLVSPWLRRQWREACIALRAILARLIPPVSLARRVLPAILARSIAPPLAWASVFPVSCVPSSSSTVAPVTAVRATADPSFSHGSELLTFVGVVGVEVVVHTVPAALERLGLISAPFGVWFCREHGSSLALHVLDLGFLLFWVGSRELEEGETPFLGSCALGR